MKNINLSPIKTISGISFKIPDANGSGVKEGNLADLLELLIFNLPPKLCPKCGSPIGGAQITMEDSIKANRLFQQIANSHDGILSLEDAEYDWIRNIIDQYAVHVFGLNAAKIKEAIEVLM